MSSARTSYQRIFILNEPVSPRINPALAVEIGLNESIVLLQIEYWISVSQHFIDGQRWTYQSVREMQKKVFPFWSIATINRTVQSLLQKGYLIEGNFNKAKYDKTRWFALNFEKLSELKSIAIQYDTGVFQNETRSTQNETRSTQNETRSTQNETTIPENTTENTTDINNILFFEPTETKTEDDSKERILSFWNSLRIIVHRQLTPEISKAFDKALKKWDEETITEAIRRYGIVYHDTEYFFKHKWKLENFLTQKNALPDFLDEGEKWQNYQRNQQQASPQSQIVYVAPNNSYYKELRPDGTLVTVIN